MSAAPLLPHPNLAVDPRTLPIGPREAFLLAQVDGQATVSDLSAVTALDETTVVEILARLEALGAIHYGSARASSIPAPTTTATSSVRLRATSEPILTESSPRPTPADREVTLTDESSSAAPLHRFDQALLDEPADLPRDTKAQILQFHAALDRATHYELLGVGESADRKTIKAAYFERVRTFHTDRFFGKDLGKYKARIERIFAAMTKAHDTLTRSVARADYDKYLENLRSTRGVRGSLPPSVPPLPRFDSAEPQIPRAPRTPNLDEQPAQQAARTGVSVEPPSAEPSSTEAASADAASDDSPFELDPVSEPPPRDSRPSAFPAESDRGGRSSSPGDSGVRNRSLDPNAARRLLARKLGHRITGQPAAPTVDREQLRKHVGEQLRQRLDARNAGEAAQVNRYVAMAEDARAKREWGSAVNFLRTALSLEPNDTRLGDLLEEVQEEADRVMADTFIEQAKYEEADGLFDRAAASYERAARGKSGDEHVEKAAPLYERAAHCLMAARGDKRRIVELARLAVTLDPKRVPARILLAQAYDLVQMRTSAIGELSRALEIDPKNEEAKHLLKQYK